MSENIEHKQVLLIVDDDDDFRKIMTLALADEGFDVEGAASGEDAIKATKKRFYDLILLDIKMPIMNGVQTLKILKEETPATDFVMITGFQDIHLAVESIKLGAKEYLTKPVEPSDLVHRIKSILRARIAENRVKELQTKFTSRLLHELRSPMGTVQSAIGFLMKGMAGPTTEQQQDVLTHIDINMTKMTALLNDMIDLTQFESGKVDLEKLPINLDEFLPHVCTRIEPQAKAKKLILNIRVDPNVPTIELDPDKIEQVIMNLLDNAFKYTNEGGTITVQAASVQKLLDGKKKEFVEISVTDSGIGIAKEELPFVFDKYKEFLTGKTSKQKTTGIGLAICRSIIEAHSGTMTVESTVGVGSSLKCYLPVDSE